jgi:molecular chaperone DnaK
MMTGTGNGRESAFGIDLGTTNSVITRLEQGRPVPIEIAGSAIVPSVVLFLDDRTVVGREARNLDLQHPERTIRSVKRKMGQDHTYAIGEKTLTPEEVSAAILRALKEGAEQQTGEQVRDVVITVPAYFNDAQRRATLRAGELAGLHVLRLLNEPTSASLVYDQVRPGEDGAALAPEGPETLLIYDLGGGTFDVSVLEVFESVREVRSTAGNSALGGDDFDEMLVRFFLDELRRGQGVDPREDRRAMARLRTLAEQTKIRLSTETAVAVREEFLTRHKGEPVHLDVRVTRRQFEEMIGDLLRSTIELSRKAVADARLGDQRLSRICLVGGSTRIPMVRALLEDAFEAEIHEEVDPDLAVGLGAAIQAGMLKGQQVERLLVDVASHSMGVRVLGEMDTPGAMPETYAPVLRRNTALPAERSQEFYTLLDNQEAVEVDVFQGEAPRVSQNSKVGSFRFPLEPRPAHTPISVRFAYDLNGVVRVSVAQSGTANEKTVAFKVADAAAPEALAAGPAGPAPDPVILRKGRALLDTVKGSEGERLRGLLARYERASGEERELAEEALLDFFLAYEDDEGPPPPQMEAR